MKELCYLKVMLRIGIKIVRKFGKNIWRICAHWIKMEVFLFKFNIILLVDDFINIFFTVLPEKDDFVFSSNKYLEILKQFNWGYPEDLDRMLTAFEKGLVQNKYAKKKLFSAEVKNSESENKEVSTTEAENLIETLSEGEIDEENTIVLSDDESSRNNVSF